MNLTLPISNPIWISFVILLLVLTIPILMQRIRCPQIAGLILTGMIIGSNGFNLIENSPSQLSFCGQLGMLFIMFFAGLEIDIEQVRKSKTHGVLFGIFTFIIPGALCYLACIKLLNLDNTVSLVISCILGSHTLIAYPIISRYGLSKLPIVTIAVIGGLIAITSALIIFSVVQTTTTKANSWTYFLRFAIESIAYIFVIIFFYPRLTRFFFKQDKNSFHHFIFIMLLLALSAGLAQLIGLESIIGAFLAGIVLGRYIQGNQALTNRIDFVGNTFFVPFFLLNTGMMINPQSFIEGWDTIRIFAILFTICTFGKWIVAFVFQKILKEDRHSRRILFGLSEAHAAGSFAISFACIKLNLMDNDTLSVIVLIVLFSCILSTLVTEYSAYCKHKLRTSQNKKESMVEKNLIHFTNHHSVQSIIDITNAIRTVSAEQVGIHVTINGEHAKDFLRIGQEILDMANADAAESGISMVFQNRIGNNINDSIVNSANESDATRILLRLPVPSQVNNHFYNDFINPFVQDYAKELLFARVSIPLNTVRNIIVIIPTPIQPNIFIKNGVKMFANMCGKIQCRIEFYSDNTTLSYIHSYADTFNVQKSHFYPIENIQDLDMVISGLKNDHLLVLWGARTEHITHKHDDFAEIFNQIQYLPAESNIMLFYPQCNLSVIENFVINKTISHRTDGDLLKILRM